MGRLRFGALAALLWALPAIASACPVCFDAEDETRGAYLFTTIALSLLPLGLAGGVAIWLRRRWLRRQEIPRLQPEELPAGVSLLRPRPEGSPPPAGSEPSPTLR